MSNIYLAPTQAAPANGTPGVLIGNLFIPMAKPPTPIPTDGLVFHAPLTETAATAETGQALTPSGAITYTSVSGIPCAYLDGGVRIDFETTGLPTNGPRTISCLCNNLGISSGDECMAFGWGGQAAGLACALGVLRESNGRYYFGSLFSDDLISDTVGGLVSLVMTVDSAKMQRLYINGKLAVSKAFTSTINTSAINGKIGAAPWNAAGWRGYIAQCRVYNRALDADEVAALASELTPAS